MASLARRSRRLISVFHHGGSRGCSGIGNGNGQCLLLSHAQWQGEGGGNAAGIVHGTAIATRVLGELLSSQVVHRIEVPAKPPPSTSEKPMAHGVIWYEDLVQQTAEVFRTLDEISPRQVFTAGGDCSSDLAPCSWLQARHEGDVAVLYIDAHADLNTAVESPSGHFHGMVLRALLGDAPPGLAPRTPLSPSALVFAGLRELDPAEHRAASRLGLRVLPPAILRAPSGGSEIERALGTTACSRVHIHLDLDVFEPKVFPHVSVPSPGGLNVEELRRLLRAAVGQRPLAGLTVTELRPTTPSDEAACADVLRELLGPNGIDVAARAAEGC